jgi:hypothetical protein
MRLALDGRNLGRLRCRYRHEVFPRILFEIALLQPSEAHDLGVVTGRMGRAKEMEKNIDSSAVAAEHHTEDSRKTTDDPSSSEIRYRPTIRPLLVRISDSSSDRSRSQMV